MKLKFIFAFLFICSTAFAQQPAPRPVQACKEFLPYGFPSAKKQNTTTICRTAYALEHDNLAKIPMWVAYKSTTMQILGCVARVNSFSADQSLKKGFRSEPTDYYNSGFDMGHLANSADMSWDIKIARESFILSNIAPQVPGLNRGVWKTLESVTRSWTYTRMNGVTIYTGSVYNANTDTKIGDNGVVVPREFYKIIIDNDNKTSLAFIFPNRDNLSNSIQNFQTTVQQIERATGIKFPVPDDKTVKKKLWSYNLSTVTEAKKYACEKDED